MPIAIDKSSLGTPVSSGGTGTTIALTTNQAVASGGFVIVCVGWWSNSVTLTGVTDDGGSPLSYAIDKQGFNGFPSCAIVSAQAPSGLASGRVITATYSGAVAGRNIGACSFTGVLASAALDTTSGPTTNAGPNWASANITTAGAGELIFALTHFETDANSTPTSPAVEALDWDDTGNQLSFTGAYRIESSSGTYSVAGAWNTGTATMVTNAAAYKPAAGIPAKAGSGVIGP